MCQTFTSSLTNDCFHNALLDNQGGISIKEPTANAGGVFGQPIRLSWTTSNIVGAAAPSFIVTALNSQGVEKFRSSAAIATLSSSVTPTADWGAVVGWGMWTASSGGSLRYADTLRNADNVPVVRNIYNGDDAPVFDAAALVLSIA